MMIISSCDFWNVEMHWFVLKSIPAEDAGAALEKRAVLHPSIQRWILVLLWSPWPEELFPRWNVPKTHLIFAGLLPKSLFWVVRCCASVIGCWTIRTAEVLHFRFACWSSLSEGFQHALERCPQAGGRCWHCYVADRKALQHGGFCAHIWESDESKKNF